MATSQPVKDVNGHGQNKAETGIDNSLLAKQMFVSSALSMSWQMAFAVMIPLVGGYYLGQYLKLNPWVTLAGFLLAVALVVLIVKRAVTNLSETTPKKSKKS